MPRSSGRTLSILCMLVEAEHSERHTRAASSICRNAARLASACRLTSQQPYLKEQEMILDRAKNGLDRMLDTLQRWHARSTGFCDNLREPRRRKFANIELRVYLAIYQSS